MVNYACFLGFDPAYKSFAWAKVYINVDILYDIYDEIQKYKALKSPSNAPPNAPKTDDLRAIMKIYFTIETLIERFIIFDNYGVCDILGAKKIKETSEVERTQTLYRFLHGEQMAPISAAQMPPKSHIIVEHQPAIMRHGAASAANDKSSVVANQLLFYYCSAADATVTYIDPKLKNNITIGEITLKNFEEKHKSKHLARKKHAEALFDRLCGAVCTQITGVSSAEKNHLADAFMGIIAYCNREGLFRPQPVVIESIRVYVKLIFDDLRRR